MFKLYLPQKFKSHWEGYWSTQTIKDNLLDCETDGLNPIFQKHLPKNGKILEAGCGIGKWVIILKKRGYDIYGVDNFKPAIEAAKKFDPSLPIAVADVIKLPYPKESFSAYISLGVIEHFESGPKDVLKEAYRVLKKGGIAIFETPYDNPLRIFRRRAEQLKFLIKSPVRIPLEKLELRKKRTLGRRFFFEYHFTRGELKKLVAEGGFKVIDLLAKDDLSESRHIGLWLDFASFRKVGGARFELNGKGMMIRRVVSYLSPWLTSCCVVCVAKK